MFAWTYKDLKGIAPELAQHIIELNTSYHTNTSSKVQIKPQLCYSYQTKY